MFQSSAYNINSKSIGLRKGNRHPCDWGNELMMFEMNSFTNSATKTTDIEQVSKLVFTYSFLRPWILKLLNKVPLSYKKHTYSSIAICVGISYFLSNQSKKFRSNYKSIITSKSKAKKNSRNICICY